MTYLRILVVFFPLFVVGCNNPAKPAAPAPEKVKSEADLAFTNLSKKAYVSLKIETQKVTVTEVNERLALTGWIMAKPGNEVTLTAPATGYVHFAKDRAPIAGDVVAVKDELLTLDPELSPIEKIQVAALKTTIESDLVKARTTLKKAEIDLARTEKLLKDMAKNQQDVEQCQTAVDHAKEDVAAATKKLTFFETQPIPLKAPLDGKVLQLHVGPGQYVPVSAPLITIIDLRPIWIRVPVPESDLPMVLRMVDPKKTVDISWKNGNHNQNGKPAFFEAKYVGRVAQVDPVKHTAELWYELLPTKEADSFVKDQMVTVHLPIDKIEKGTVVPYSAIVFDVHGRGLIYLERTTDKDTKHQFERRPIELVSSADDGKVVIRTYLTGGERVVTNGAAVLFSRDFHKTPVNIPGEDD
jgi:RND family efflux transporter MFP subunit